MLINLSTSGQLQRIINAYYYFMPTNELIAYLSLQAVLPPYPRGMLRYEATRSYHPVNVKNNTVSSTFPGTVQPLCFPCLVQLSIVNASEAKAKSLKWLDFFFFFCTLRSIYHLLFNLLQRGLTNSIRNVYFQLAFC
jgi:hypothetical protein